MSGPLLNWLDRNLPIQSLILTTSFLVIAVIPPASAQSVADHPDWPGKGQLFVGTCYQPIDRTPEEIRQDIAIMKKADPGDAVNTSLGALMTKGDLDAPIWFNEFTAGGGGYYGTKGRSRMWAYIGLINYAQTILAWTFNSHRGGEEQALFGLVDHDGTPSWKVDEFAQIASEFRKLQSLGFPRFRKPEVAIAYSFDSYIASNPPGPSSTVRQYYLLPYGPSRLRAARPTLRSLCEV